MPDPVECYSNPAVAAAFLAQPPLTKQELDALVIRERAIRVAADAKRIAFAQHTREARKGRKEAIKAVALLIETLQLRDSGV